MAEGEMPKGLDEAHQKKWMTEHHPRRHMEEEGSKPAEGEKTEDATSEKVPGE